MKNPIILLRLLSVLVLVVLMSSCATSQPGLGYRPSPKVSLKKVAKQQRGEYLSFYKPLKNKVETGIRFD